MPPDSLQLRDLHEGKNLVMAKGVYDLLHVGHLYSLIQAKELGDSLIVALAGDESVARRKGVGRPIIPLRERIAMVAAMDCVSYVTWYNEARPFEIVCRVRPARFVASHFDSLTTKESELLREMGVVLTTLQKPAFRSTSQIVEAARLSVLPLDGKI